MPEVTNELMYELLKRLDHRVGELHLIATESDMKNIYGVLARRDARLERIEFRLKDA
ncbi:hypothetical protein [Mesorhizobium opportunistum]|uniref:Uncharacterized protein n=1 Tax=Mesorhizobium opportunistum (strain LMG 24607 / HAMBI 3007 / WSM2075) TaxID=536019 RepID=F7YHB5_MESOW|nr:hypothetical protein [Mesorhizobium opportunistum]AEH89215.1 conserved hypothetical protein [Mesorhizobium opportunistum WSM2075]